MRSRVLCSWLGGLWQSAQKGPPVKISQLAAQANLRLAWRRITTGGNHQYKRLFRHLYVAYEVALDDNLADLHGRLRGGTFCPQQPERIYLPKSSGLHRPLSLLHVEDQIVLQAFANLAAKRLYARRAPLQFKVVFSNILRRDNSIFFFKRWQETYAAFQRRIRKHYDNGLRWVGDFDLAAFYDTVSHELLVKTIYPRTPINGDMEWLCSCLGTWSSEKASSRHGHGIPQGPIASDFLAECFLLPIDLALQKAPGYTRYVDDVRLFGKTEDDVRESVIQLERRCREHGLIPQTGKFAIKHSTGVKDAMGMLPSIADPQRSAGPARSPLPRERARSWLLSSLGGKPYRVHDKTRLRYVLYRAEPDSEILRLVCRLVPHHPEHADAFFRYLGTFDARKTIIRLCLDVIGKNPYPYVRGEAWLLVARHLTTPRALEPPARKALVKKAIAIAKKRRPENFTETLGACHFLAVAETVEKRRYSRFLKFQPPLLQAFVADVLPDAAFARGEAADAYLRATAFEPGISICGRVHALGLGLATFRITPTALSSQVRNTFCELGTIPTRGGPVDPIAEVLQKRYGLATSKSWHDLLGTEYVHALGLLKQAEAAFNAGMSYWLATQNSFHHAIFLALQRHLATVGHAAACTIKGKDGKLVDFGVMLDAGGPFAKDCPVVADCFRAMNTRRNQLPVSHPYEKKTEKRSKHLSAQERNRFVHDLSAAFPVWVGLMP
jgi:hypothetical protein